MTRTRLVKVRKLRKYFTISTGGGNPFKKRVVRALDGIDMDIFPGETLGLVGESGCGKTTLGRCILKLTEVTSGEVFLNSQSIIGVSGRKMRQLRKNMQIIFQNPFSSLDPRMKVGDIVRQPLNVFPVTGQETRLARVHRVLDAVGLEPDSIDRFPHEFSGGQRQRIAIARALAPQPQFIVADEPVSALDVSIRAQILNLMKALKKQFQLTYLFISHDLSTVKFISDRVMVMYLGKIVEAGTVEQIFKTPAHPYTRALMEAIPIPDPLLRRDRKQMKGEPPSPISPPSGCRFHPRCPRAEGICEKVEPGEIQVLPEHKVFCHFPELRKDAGAAALK